MCVAHDRERGLKPDKLPKGSVVQEAILEEPTLAETVLGGACVGTVCTLWGNFVAVPILAVFFTVTVQPVKASLCWACTLSPILLRRLDTLVPALGLGARQDNFGIARICTSIGKHGRRYFGKGSAVVFESEEALNQTNAGSVFICHSPHGVFVLSTVFNLQWRPAASKSWVMISSTLRYFGGLFVSYLERNSRLLPNSRDVLLEKVKLRDPIALTPGGFFSATQMKYDEDTEHIGFGIVKIALANGYDLVPVWHFGETTTYYNFQVGMKYRMALNKYGIPGIMPFGRWWFPLLPRRGPLMSVHGTPIKMPKIENPTKADVEEHAQRYCDGLKALYEKYKYAYFPQDIAKDRHLRIVNEPKDAKKTK
jgi:2-acylglycerol O-acyltransferase 2